ncbi:MAG: hypothetical protein WA659_04810 [Candidatus Aquirickettsiella sp.]
MTTESFSINQANKHSDFFAIQQFFSTVGNDLNLTQAVLINEYLNNSDSYGSFIYLMDNDEVVGGLGNIAFDLLKAGQTHNTLMLDRVLVSKPYWGKKVFDKLISESDALTKSLSRNGFFWGVTPVPKSFVRIGYHSYNTLREYTLALETFDCELNNKNISLIYNYSDDIRSYLLARSIQHYETYFLMYSQQKYFWFVSEKDLLQRKMLRFYYQKKMIGFAVTRIASKNTIIIDDIHIDEEFVLPAPHLIVNEVKNSGYKKINIIVNTANEVLSALLTKFLQCGFDEINYKGQLVVKSFDGSPLSAEQLHLTRMWAPPNWLPSR